MIKIKDILKAANRILKAEFPNIPRESQDTKEGFTRECFFVQADGIKENSFNEMMRESSLILRVFYFPKNEHINISEILDMQEKLREIFSPVIFINEDFAIPINDCDFEITDNHVLVLDMRLEYWQQIEESGEDIENLEYNTISE